MKPKPHIERCAVWVVPAGAAVIDGHRCRLTATTTRDEHRVCHRHATMTPVRYVDETRAATAGHPALERT